MKERKKERDRDRERERESEKEKNEWRRKQIKMVGRVEGRKGRMENAGMDGCVWIACYFYSSNIYLHWNTDRLRDSFDCHACLKRNSMSNLKKWWKRLIIEVMVWQLSENINAKTVPTLDECKNISDQKMILRKLMKNVIRLLSKINKSVKNENASVTQIIMFEWFWTSRSKIKLFIF